MKNKPDLNKPVIKLEEFESFKVAISQRVPFDLRFGNMTVTDYELLTQVIWLLNKVIDVTNAYTVKIDEVLNWLVEDGLREAVLQQLNIWLADGTLEELINETLFKTKLDKITFEDFKVEYEQWKLEQKNWNEKQLEKNEELDEELIVLDSKKLDKLTFEDFINSNLSELNKKLDKTEFNKFKLDNDKKIDDNINQQQDLFIELSINNVVSKDIQGGSEQGVISLMTIPLKNKDGSINSPRTDYFKDGKSVEDNLSENKVLVFNSGYGKGSHGYGPEGRLIIDGVIIQDEPGRTENYKTLVWNTKGEMTMIDNTITCAQILAMGYNNSIGGYRHVVNRGVVQWWDVTEKAQRTAIGKLTNGDYVVVVSNGRTSSDIGFSIPSFADEVKKLLGGKLQDLYMLDGGGSTQANLYGTNLVIQGDENFTKFRDVFIQSYFERPKKTQNSTYNNDRNSLGEFIQTLTYDQSKFKFTRTVSDFNDCKENGFFYGSPSTLNKPVQGSGYIICLKNNGGNVTQIYVANTSKQWEEQAGMEMRTFVLSGNYWTDWVSPQYNACKSISDLNSAYRTGKYYCPASSLNLPPNLGNGYLDVYNNTDGSIMQLYYPQSIGSGTTAHYAKRTGSFKLASKETTWNAWKVYE